MASCVATMQVAPAAVQTAGQAIGGKNALVSAFVGNGLKKHEAHASFGANSKGRSCIVCQSEETQTDKDRWKGLVYDISDDQQDIARGKGMVDTLFQGPQGGGTQTPIMSSLDYINTSQRLYNMDNMKDGYYIAPAFMDKLVVHISKNFINLPNIKVPLILGIWGGKGQGKSFQCELVFAKMGINPIMMSAGELESGNAGEPAKLIRQRYREAADVISKKGQMCVLFINDLDAGAGRMGGTTQYTVNNQMVNATLMNIADNPTSVQLPGVYSKQEIPRVPIIVTGNDFSTLYAPLIRDGRMEKFYWAPTREDRIGVCQGIFKADGVHPDEVVKLVDTFPGQSIDFFGALRARVYDDEVRNWIGQIGVENMGAKLVNSKEGPPKFKKPAITIEKLLEYGYMLVNEQENVKRVQLAEKYMSQAALGDANEDAIKQGMFYGKAAQQVDFRVPEGCTDPGAANFDPTARSDDGTCIYDFQDNSTTGDGALKDGAKEAVASTAEETPGTLEAANKEENSEREVTPALEEVVKQENIERVAKVEDSPVETVGKSESSNKVEDAKQPELKAATSAPLAAKQVELSSAAKLNPVGEAAKVEQPAASPDATPAVEQVAKVEQSPAANLKNSNQVGEVDKKQPEIKSASTNNHMQAIGHGESVSVAKRNFIIQAGTLYGFARLPGLLESIALAEDCSNQPCPAITQKVFFDIAIDGQPAGRIVVGLYGDEVPIGAKRFGEIAVGQKGVSYRKRDFTKITRSYIQNSGLRTFTLSGRDKDIARFTGGLTAAELVEEMKSLEQKGARPMNVKGSVSIVAIDAKKPPAKPKLISRDGKFEVVYEESRPDPNGTEFCMAYDDAPELDPTNLVVGRVVEGMEVVGKIAGTRVVQDNTSNPYFQTAKLIGDTRAVVAERGFNRPYSKIVISKSGSID